MIPPEIVLVFLLVILFGSYKGLRRFLNKRELKGQKLIETYTTALLISFDRSQKYLLDGIAYHDTGMYRHPSEYNAMILPQDNEEPIEKTRERLYQAGIKVETYIIPFT